jgi:hypothetical protein
MKVGRTEGQPATKILVDAQGNTARFASTTTDYGDYVAESTQIRVDDENGHVHYGASKITHSDGTVETRVID